MVDTIIDKRWSSNTYHSARFISLSDLPQDTDMLFYSYYGFITSLVEVTLLIILNYFIYIVNLLSK